MGSDPAVREGKHGLNEASWHGLGEAGGLVGRYGLGDADEPEKRESESEPGADALIYSGPGARGFATALANTLTRDRGSRYRRSAIWATLPMLQFYLLVTRRNEAGVLPVPYEMLNLIKH